MLYRLRYARGETAECQPFIAQFAVYAHGCNFKTGDYHEDINGSPFFKWVDEKLKDKLLPNSVVAIDNASYHSVQAEKKPTIASLKAEQQNWRYNVEFSETMTKTQLQLLINNTQK
ncbi:hypothetical protein EVAR_63816_1 [Eumeta japonica]|uniref:Tc1-like transposase DDE domain-containing protein n=1 Tax=Eumeta variegata TaxID=151549 RepID=A0A4C1ZMP3_EUMVA|nr:hypothetical protein EVAR_63816_1 [Eumeta japonica]